MNLSKETSQSFHTGSLPNDFSNLKIEVMPLKAEEYAELKEHGLNGVICFQETYNKARYNIYHPRGMKSKFEWRVNGFDRMGQAGVHSIGMGDIYYNGLCYKFPESK